MAVMGAVFFMCGFLPTLNDVLIPHLKSVFSLTYFQVMFIQFSFFSAFLIFAFPSGKLVEAVGYRLSITVGVLVMAAGSVLVATAGSVPAFGLFMIALAIVAAGDTCLQVAGNAYVSVLGEARTSSARLNLTQAFNSVGSTLAPFFGAHVIFRGVKSAAESHIVSAHALKLYRLEEARTVVVPYLGIALWFVTLSFVVWINLTRMETRSPGADRADNATRSVWKRRSLVLGAIGIFVYAGAEISIGGFLANYLALPIIGGLTIKTAAAYVSVYWGGSMVGRFIASIVLRRVATGPALAFVAVCALALVLVSFLSAGSIAMWGIIAVGLFNSIMFPSIFGLGIANMGAFTGKAAGILMAAAVGGAIIPVLQGALADSIGVHHSFILPACCYAYVLYYALTQSGSPASPKASPPSVRLASGA